MANIDEIIRKVAAGMQPISNYDGDKSEIISDANDQFVGDPDCPICHGIGFYRRELPVSDPYFGKMEICVCRQEEVIRNAHKRLYQFANLEALKKFTFISFEATGKDRSLNNEELVSLEAAHSRSKEFAGDLFGWLLIRGKNGSGKTHLAAAIANQSVSLGVPTLFLTSPDLLDWLRFAYSDPDTTFEQRFEEIRNIKLLIIDDFGTENATPWAQEKLFQILNYRYLNCLPTVITSNNDPDLFEKRIRSRIMDSEFVRTVYIDVPDFRNPKRAGDDPVLSSLRLYNNQTFDKFSLRNGERIKPEELATIQKALVTAKKYAENPKGWLMIIGPYGTGKTHLAAAIGNYQKFRGNKTMFIDVPDLMDHLRATFHPESRETYDQRFEEVKSTQLLILDDLGGKNTSPWVRDRLFQLVNYRYSLKLSTVITSSLEMKDLDERLQTRLLDKYLCNVIKIQVPPFFRLEDILDKPQNFRGRNKGTVKI